MSEPGRTDGRQVRWNEHNEGRRARIIAAAIEFIDAGRGDVSLQEIGERAGLSRSVVYRQFRDRRELDLAVQRQVMRDLFSHVSTALLGGGSPMEIMRRTADVYVHWAAEHPSLHRLSDADSLTGDGPMQQMVDRISRDLSGVIVDGFEAFGAPMSEADRAATDPLIYGIVGFWFGVIRRWVNLGASDPDAAHLIEVLVESTWPIIDARARSYGLALDPNAPIPFQDLIDARDPAMLQTPRPRGPAAERPGDLETT